MSKWNEENVLYFSKVKASGFEVSKDAASQTELRRLIKRLMQHGFLSVLSQCKFKVRYVITQKGCERLSELKELYNKIKNKHIKEPSESECRGTGACAEDKKGFHVYFGFQFGEIVYIGTTIQKPKDRWRWHKSNGKNLDFKLHKSYQSADEMIDDEFRLIKKYKPKLNKITTRKQNLNVKLTNEQLSSRVGDGEWCQSCLRRRARKGSTCDYC